MQLLGPNQEIWVQAIESGKYPQGRQDLNCNGRFCCLGVACELFSVVIDSFQLCGGLITRYGTEEDSEPCSSLAPIGVIKALALRDEFGHISEAFGILPHSSLSTMNDKGLDFPTIAKFIRENPEKVFTEPR